MFPVQNIIQQVSTAAGTGTLATLAYATGLLLADGWCRCWSNKLPAKAVRKVYDYETAYNSTEIKTKRYLYLRHLLQFSTNILPCNSDSNSRGSPDFKCNPSIFWLTTYLTWPVSVSAFNAMCVFDGIASLNEILMSGFSPLPSNVQTPFGPLDFDFDFIV